MPRQPKVSVVIPTYNRAEYIEAAVDSVRQQTLRDVEIIVVDDGSTDDTLERLRRFGSEVACLRTPNQGPAAARNVGMQAARGEYIAWLDSDDLYRPYKLELQSTLLDLRPEVGFVYSEFCGFDDQGYHDEWHLRRYHESGWRHLRYEDVFTERTPLSTTPLAATLAAAGHGDWCDRSVYIGRIFDHYLLGTVVFTNSILFRRTLLERCGLQARRFGLFHDLEFVLRLSRLAPAAFLDVPTYELRYHPGQISTTATPSGTLVAIRKQRDLLRVLKTYRRDDPAYYLAHKDAIDRQLARLHRAVALPMLAWQPPSARARRRAARHARLHLAKAAALGQPDRVAWLQSFMPGLVLRAALATVRTLRALTGARRRRSERPR
jgi:glycosyltransferase involved in cell wall biosynthesis